MLGKALWGLEPRWRRIQAAPGLWEALGRCPLIGWQPANRPLGGGRQQGGSRSCAVGAESWALGRRAQISSEAPTFMPGEPFGAGHDRVHAARRER